MRIRISRQPDSSISVGPQYNEHHGEPYGRQGMRQDMRQDMHNPMYHNPGYYDRDDYGMRRSARQGQYDDAYRSERNRSERDRMPQPVYETENRRARSEYDRMEYERSPRSMHQEEFYRERPQDHYGMHHSPHPSLHHDGGFRPQEHQQHARRSTGIHRALGDVGHVMEHHPHEWAQHLSVPGGLMTMMEMEFREAAEAYRQMKSGEISIGEFIKHLRNAAAAAVYVYDEMTED